MYEFSDFKKIDMHSHIGTWGNPFNFSGDINLVIDLMDKFNIEKTVLCPSDSSKNADILEAYEKAKDQIIPVPWVDCTKEQAAYDELEYLIRDKGCKGAKIQSLFDGYAADSPIVDPVAEICESYNVPFFVHSGHEPFSLPWQIGLLAERHPKCKFVMLHMGHGHGIYVEAAQTIAKRYKNIWLETSGTSMTAQIFNAYKNVGNDRVMFGLDTPFHAPEVEIQKILSCPLKEKDYENIFYNNAKNFLGSLLD